MEYILSPKQMAALDAHMIEEQGIHELTLMENAAFGVTEAVLSLLAKRKSRVIAFCGAGNNGGDGLAALRQLCMRGVEVCAVLLKEPYALRGGAKAQYDMARACGVEIHICTTAEEVDCVALEKDWIVIDALFGTGLSRALTGHYQVAVRRMNACGAKIVAVDIPSGIDGATGQILCEAVRADITVTFQHKKLGHFFYPGKTHAGELRLVPIGAPKKRMERAAEHLQTCDIAQLLKARDPNSHKGKFGRALIIAGSEHYMGAAVLSALAALRGGTGLLHTACPGALIAAMAACPGAIAHPCGGGKHWESEEARAVYPLMETANALAIGPGMGGGGAAHEILLAALQTKKPLLIDADGLNALASHTYLYAHLHERVILTPHVREMQRLTGKDMQAIIKDPILAACEAAQAWGCVVHVKGAVSVSADKHRHCLCTEGNAGLAKGGSGDVLTGLALAMLAQGLSPYDAICVAAYLLGAAADEAVALLGVRALLPTDVTDAIEKLYKDAALQEG